MGKLQEKRLEEAIEEEEEDNKKKLNGDKKRSRVDSDSIGSGKINAVEEYKKMSVKELRDVATSRGISSTGSKKELVERLCAVADSQKNDSKDDLGGTVVVLLLWTNCSNLPSYFFW